MKRLRPLLGILPLLGLWASALSAQAPAGESFGEVMEVNVVNVEVYVTDKKGNRVMDLRQEDFEVREDGKPVAITNFQLVPPRGSGRESVPPAAGSPAPAAPAGAGAGQDAWSLVVFLDDSNLRPANRHRALTQIREFLARQTAPGDRVMVVRYGPGFEVRLPFSSDPAAVAKALTEMEPLMASGPQIERDRRQAMENVMTIQEIAILDPLQEPCPQNLVQPAHDFAAARRQEVQRGLGALTLLVNSLSGMPGRKAVLHVSDGIPLIPGEEVFQLLVELCGGGATAGIGSQDDPLRAVYDARAIGPVAYQAASQALLDAADYNIAKDLHALTAHANAHQVSLYMLQPGLAAPEASDASTGPNELIFRFPTIGSVLRANNRDSLQLLADDTGGRAILDANDALPDLARLRDDLSGYYSLGFTPPHAGDGREHRIAVKVKRPGLRLRYRQSYRDKPMVEKTVDRTLAALYHGIEENPLEIAMEIGDPAPGQDGLWTVPVQLKIPLFKLAILNREQTFEGSLRVFLITRSADGASSPVRQVSVPIRIDRTEVLRAMGQFYLYTLTLNNLKPGEQRVAIAVRDQIAATTSYLSRAVTVPVPSFSVKQGEG